MLKKRKKHLKKNKQELRSYDKQSLFDGSSSKF